MGIRNSKRRNDLMDWNLYYIVWGVLVAFAVQIFYDYLGGKFKDKPKKKLMVGIVIFCVIAIVLGIWAIVGNL
jgi:hypothetical protein